MKLERKLTVVDWLLIALWFYVAFGAIAMFGILNRINYQIFILTS
jgi:hypothetical protein